ncbi:unnamed protein product [Rangifer tarandus platyrhynchus]|uniref:Uncharacterized protein n=1 Tax=Rangifer tarandus platyrhynchus TaxID=3082113 RepID=A0AC59YJ33_RANTA
MPGAQPGGLQGAPAAVTRWAMPDGLGGQETASAQVGVPAAVLTRPLLVLPGRRGGTGRLWVPEPLLGCGGLQRGPSAASSVGGRVVVLSVRGARGRTGRACISEFTVFGFFSSEVVDRRCELFPKRSHHEAKGASFCSHSGLLVPYAAAKGSISQISVKLITESTVSS